MSWDESVQRNLGMVTYDYVVKGDKSLAAYHDRGLGTGFELPLIFIEKAVHLTDSRDIYLARHIVTHIFFLLGVFCGYILTLRLFKNQFIACLGYILLAFHPRIYAHSFFNSKDIPFLAAFLVALLLFQIAFEKNRNGWYVLLGIACGYATSIRSMGIILLPCAVVFFLADLVHNRHLKGNLLHSAARFLSFTVGFCSMLYVAWPYLWSAPLHNFMEGFRSLANIQWGGEVLFNGKYYKGDQLPWNYMPVWFSITIPELFLCIGLTGCVWVLILFFTYPRKWITNVKERNFLLHLACFVGPVLAMTVLHGVNIDDWRHVYFIYPSFVMLAMFAIHKLVIGRLSDLTFLRMKVKWVVWVLCLGQIGITGSFMVQAHPFQEVYFNHFISHGKEYLRYHYDMDYWGCAYKQGMENILANDTSNDIHVLESILPVLNAISFLPPSARKRVLPVSGRERPDYFFTNFRNHPQDYDYPKTVFEIRVLNSAIFRSYKMH